MIEIVSILTSFISFGICILSLWLVQPTLHKKILLNKVKRRQEQETVDWIECMDILGWIEDTPNIPWKFGDIWHTIIEPHRIFVREICLRSHGLSLCLSIGSNLTPRWEVLHEFDWKLLEASNSKFSVYRILFL